MKNITEQPITTKKGTFPAGVAAIISDQKLAINRGREHGLKEGQRVLVYRLSDEEIKDPNTGESLGYLEIVKGTGKVINVQENLATIESDKIILVDKPRSPFQPPPSWESPIQKEPVIMPFDNPQIGDSVKPI
jgi:hypothetical protein